MFGFLKRAKAEREATTERIRKNWNAEVMKKTKSMQSSPCAIRNFLNCDSECVHFQKGVVKYLDWSWSCGEPVFWVELPKCKLWK